MKLLDVLTESTKLKNGQKIRVTAEKSPEFANVPTAGPSKSKYFHRFEKGTVLRVYSWGSKLVTVDVETPGTMVYLWANGKTTSTIDLQKHKWKTSVGNFDDSSWFELVNDDIENFPDLITDLEQAKAWLDLNAVFYRGLKKTEDGFDAERVVLDIEDDDKIRLKFRNVKAFVITKVVDDYSNLPTECETLMMNLGKLRTMDGIKVPTSVAKMTLTGGMFTTLDKIPDLPNLEWLRLVNSKIESLKGLRKKFPKLDDVILERPRLKSGLLELAKQKLIVADVDGSPELKKALSIIMKHSGSGPKAPVAAQRELIDNDLEDFG